MEVVITSLCHRTQHYADVWGSRHVVAYEFTTQAPDRDEWSASLPGCWQFQSTYVSIHHTGGWVNPRAHMDRHKETNFRLY